MKEYMSSLPEDQRPSPPPQEKQGMQNSGGQQQATMGPPPGAEMDESHQIVWVKEGNSIKPVPVETGINDGSHIEILAGLSEGDLVVTSMEKVTGKKTGKKDQEDEEKSSPFVQERGGKGGPPR